MKLRVLLLFMVPIAIFPACGSSPKQNASGAKDEQVQRLKDYSFCSCLRACLPKTDSLLIKDGSSAGYFEKSSFSEGAFERIDSLAQKGGLASYKSKTGKPLCIMKCLDFYNSAALDSLLIEMSREKSPNGK